MTTDSPIKCTVIHSRRRTASMQVTPEGVNVRVPHGVSQAWIDQWLVARQTWIQRQQSQLQSHRIDIVQGGRLPFNGEWLELTWRAGNRTDVSRSGSRLQVACGPSSRLTDVEQVTAAIKRWYKRQATAHLSSRLEFWQQQMQTNISGWKVRDYKRRWGSCSAVGEVALNWRLMLAEPVLQDYVIIHELCHLEHFDHSPAFWRAVAAYCPDWQAHRKSLRQRSAWMLW
ncbi:M48 family metallopeptidase [Pontibacter sp. JAM-7]|uniref:M48 family metallopeptidase n=1 Tax=Pontibacter sp. JAM-7 TaxID=3366581 RepID=UPI003AF4863A